MERSYVGLTISSLRTLSRSVTASSCSARSVYTSRTNSVVKSTSPSSSTMFSRSELHRIWLSTVRPIVCFNVFNGWSSSIVDSSDWICTRAPWSERRTDGFSLICGQFDNYDYICSRLFLQNWSMNQLIEGIVAILRQSETLEEVNRENQLNASIPFTFILPLRSQNKELADSSRASNDNTTDGSNSSQSSCNTGQNHLGENDVFVSIST